MTSPFYITAGVGSSCFYSQLHVRQNLNYRCFNGQSKPQCHINEALVKNVALYNLKVHRSSNMKLNPKMDHTQGKINKTAGLLRRNFSFSSSHGKEELNVFQLKYSCEFWSQVLKN